MLNLFMALSALAGPQIPVADTNTRFSALGVLKVGAQRSMVAVRCEDLGSVGNPQRDPAYRNRWHYIVLGVRGLAPFKDLWTTVTVSFTPGEMHLDVAGWGSMDYVSIDVALRPRIWVSEADWQRVSLRALDEDTWEILIEEPTGTVQAGLGPVWGSSTTPGAESQPSPSTEESAKQAQ